MKESHKLKIIFGKLALGACRHIWHLWEPIRYIYPPQGPFLDVEQEWNDVAGLQNRGFPLLPGAVELLQIADEWIRMEKYVQ